MPKKSGFIQLILILILFIVILSLLGISISSVFENKLVRDNFSFVWDWLDFIWQRWLAGPFWTVWDFGWNFLNDFIWSAFIKAMDAIKAGRNPILNQ